MAAGAFFTQITQFVRAVCSGAAMNRAYRSARIRSVGSRRVTSVGVAAVAALSVILFGCGGSSSPRSAGHVGTNAGSDQADLSGGFTTVSAPLTARGQPLVVGAGNRVFVFGGFHIDDAANTQINLSDGAILDIPTGKWTQLPDAPFPAPLRRPTGAWLGAEVVVAGTPCGETSVESELAVCKPGGLAAAAYSPSSGTWRSINPPEWSRSADRLDVTVVGAVAGQVVLSTNAPDPKHRLVLLDPASETWSYVPTLPSADAICVAGGELVGVRTGAVDASGETGTASATSLSHPLETFSLDPLNGSGQWKELSSLKKNASLDTLLERVDCSDDQLIYVPIWRPPVGIDVGALWYEGGGKWSALPSFKSAGFSGAPSPALSGSTRVVWVDNGGGLYLQRADAEEWSRFDTPMPGSVAVKHLDGGILLLDGLRERAPSDDLVLGLLQPDLYADNPSRVVDTTSSTNPPISQTAPTQGGSPDPRADPSPRP